MARYRVGIIGRFAFGKNLLNGQVIKTKIVSSALADAFGEDNIHQVDTYGGVKALLRLPIQCIAELAKCMNVIILPAYKGVRVVVPVLAVGNLLIRRRLHYVVIGGWLPRFLKHKPFLRLCLRSFDGLYVETQAMKRQLENQGFDNVLVMANFKNLFPLYVDDLIYATKEPYRLCTFSRVMREKGIDVAVEAVKAVNAHYGRTVYTLDIYGQIEETEIGWFHALQQTFPSYIHYGGMVPFEKSVEVLKDCFALLFPTKFYTEGNPGTIIDAYAAGVPVIASMWENYTDMIDESTGLGYPFDRPEILTNILLEVAEKPEILLEKKQACLMKAEKFQPQTAIIPLLKRLR